MKLTLLPMLASAAAAAQPAPPPDVPDAPEGPVDGPPGGGGPPGMTEPVLAPPGMTDPLPPDAPAEQPLVDPVPENCHVEWDGTIVCDPIQLPSLSFSWGGSSHRIHHRRYVYRGGFGHYFWSAGS